MSEKLSSYFDNFLCSGELAHFTSELSPMSGDRFHSVGRKNDVAAHKSVRLSSYAKISPRKEIKIGQRKAFHIVHDGRTEVQ
jgi:hypothetical protein